MENTKNTFFAKAIENWLTNTNELGYQLPFCQLLLNEGFRTVHISKHNAFEQGKDIIAIDKDGLTHIYQLKGGNISLGVWRKIVKPEIEELIDLTIVHPSVDKSKSYIPYLVTNGYLDDTVRVQIENLNAGKWQANPLRVILLPDLLVRFIEWTYEFTPQEIENYRTFLELYFADGSDLVDEEKLANLLESILRLSEAKLPKAERKRNIGAAVLLAGYVIAPHNEKQNHIAIVQTLVLLAAHILAVAEKYALKEAFWKPSFELVWDEINTNMRRLEKEVCEGAFEHIFEDLWDGELAPYRRHTAISYLLAFKLSQCLRSDAGWDSLRNAPILSEMLTRLVVASEGSLIAFLCAHFYLQRLEIESEEMFLILPLEFILFFNGRRGTFGLPSPYHGMDTAIKVNLGLLEENELRDDFLGRSFLIESFTHLLARANRRDILEKYWREISYLQLEKFLPGDPWEWFRWRTKNGTNISEFPRATESWADLKFRAAKVEESSIPPTLASLKYFLPLFLLVYPHRANTASINYLAHVLETN